MWKTNQFYFKRYNENQNKFSKPLVFFNKIKKKGFTPKKNKTNKQTKNKNKKTLPAKKNPASLIFVKTYSCLRNRKLPAKGLKCSM
jgi:hypothetical protein